MTFIGIGLGMFPASTGGGGGTYLSSTYGLVTATKDGSTGQTYTLNASWTGIQWYRMALASPNAVTAIAGATSSTYVAQAADEGYRLVCAGTSGGSQLAAKAYHVVLPPPVLLEDFESTTGWAATNGGQIDLVTDSVDYGTNRLRLTSTGTVNAQATKASIGSFDPSLLGTIAFAADLGMDAGRQTTQSNRVVLQRGGVDQYVLDVTNTGVNFETPSPIHIGKLWGAYHVSEVAGLATPGISAMGLYVRQANAIPYSQETKYDALLGKAGGRPTVIFTFDDNKVSQYTFAYPLFQSLGMVGGIYMVGSTSGNPAALDIPKIKEMYAAGWDVGLDSTYNDDITAYFGTLAAAGASLQQNKDLAIANGITRGNQHGCWTGGQIETNPPSTRVSVASVTATGVAAVTMASTTGIVAGMRAIGHNVPNSPVTTVVSVDSGTQVTLSAAIPAQTKPMKFEDTSPEFYTMKSPVYYRDVLGMKTMRTTRAQGGMHTRFGLGDRGMFTFGNAIHNLTYAEFTALIDQAILRGTTIEFYTHGVIPGGGGVESDTTDFTAKLNYVAAKRDAGLLDVMPWSQVWARDGNASVPAGLSAPPSGGVSAISFVSASSDINAPAAPTGHASGDVLLAFAYRDGSALAPSLPSGWTAITSDALNGQGFLLAYKVASSSSETIGTFTNATNVLVHCYRGASASTPIGANSAIASGTSGSVVVATGWTLQKTDNTSWVAYFGGSRSATSNLDTTTNRSGHTNATSGSDVGGSDTLGPVSSVGALTVASSSGGTNWYAIAVEIKV